jgi:hypothetical protein
LPGAESWLAQIDDDRGPTDDGVLVDGVTLGGYPEVAERGLAKPAEPVDGAEFEGASVEEVGVLHTESRELESLGEKVAGV